MLKAYHVFYNFSINGKTIYTVSDIRLLEDTGVTDTKEIILQGDDFSSLATVLKDKNLPHWYFNFSCFGKTLFKKEPTMYFFYDIGCVCYRSKEIQKWEVTKTVKEYNISMKELFNMRDSEKVIQYLKERGIYTCPILNNT